MLTTSLYLDFICISNLTTCLQRCRLTMPNSNKIYSTTPSLNPLQSKTSYTTFPKPTRTASHSSFPSTNNTFLQADDFRTVQQKTNPKYPYNFAPTIHLFGAIGTKSGIYSLSSLTPILSQFPNSNSYSNPPYSDSLSTAHTSSMPMMKTPARFDKEQPFRSKDTIMKMFVSSSNGYSGFTITTLILRSSP